MPRGPRFGGAFVAGSGFPLLTAAHVLQNLPNRGEVALLLFPGNERRLQKQTIDMALADKVMLAAATFGSSGPDLGFLRLPEVNVENLRATNSFCSISDRRDG